MGIFAIPPQLTARSSWELYECDASILLQNRNVQLIPRASQMSMSSCRPESQQPHMLFFNLVVQLYQHSKDIQIVVRTFMQRAREKLLMSDAAAPISPSINLKVRHGFLGLWAQPQEPAAANVLVMASLLVAQLAVSHTSLWQNSSAALR